MRLNLPPPCRLLPLVLVLCIGALPVGGCGGKKPSKEEAIERYSRELHAVVADKVQDEARKAQMLQIVDRLEALQLRFGHDTESLVTSYRRLNGDYQAERAAFDQLFADYNATRIRARAEALDLHFQLAALATDDEWRPIAKAETNLYQEVSEARPVETAE